MKIGVYIVEDNAITARDLSEILSEHGMDVLGTSYSGEEALTQISTIQPDIFLVDIKLKGDMSGIDFVRKMQDIKPTPVVYLTANSDNSTVQRALDTVPSAFLTKPFDQTEVVVAIELAFKNQLEKSIKSIDSPKTPYVFIKTTDRFEKVAIEQIDYIEAEGSYSKIVTSDKDYILTGNLNQYGKLSDSFLRIHRSFIVNMNNICSMDSNNIFVQNKALPIGRSYKNEVKNLLKKLS